MLIPATVHKPESETEKQRSTVDVLVQVCVEVTFMTVGTQCDRDNAPLFILVNRDDLPPDTILRRSHFCNQHHVLASI